MFWTPVFIRFIGVNFLQLVMVKLLDEIKKCNDQKPTKDIPQKRI